MSNVQTYDIGGKTYEQRELTYGQVRQLVDLLKSCELRDDVALDYTTILSTLGDKLMPAIAIVITEQGKSPRDKDLAALADEFEFVIPASTVQQIVADFFALTPVDRLIAAVTGGVQMVAAFQAGLSGSPTH